MFSLCFWCFKSVGRGLALLLFAGAAAVITVSGAAAVLLGLAVLLGVVASCLEGTRGWGTLVESCSPEWCWTRIKFE